MSREEQKSRMAVLMFTDIAGSVAIKERLGPAAYARLLIQHHQLFNQAIASVRSGHLRKSIGDGLLSEFGTAADAVNAALRFQMLLRQSKWETDAPRVRIGIHQGQLAEIELDANFTEELLGMVVDIASRIVSAASPGQILMTRAVYDDARQFVRDHPLLQPDDPPGPKLKWVPHGPYHLEGAGDFEIFQVGAAGSTPFNPPPGSEKTRRAAGLEPRLTRPWIPAAVTALCGLVLLTPLGRPWMDASYDYIFRFGSRSCTNKLALVLIDNTACLALNQSRFHWDRALHTELLKRLAADGASLVVFDIFFSSPREPAGDAALAAAMKKHGRVLLMSMVTDPNAPRTESYQAFVPFKPFLDAATNTGVGKAAPSEDGIVRRHWPFPAPAEEVSLAWRAAELLGAHLNQKPEEQWVRYYAEKGPWESFSYNLALSNSPGFFRDKVVFVGSKPQFPDPKIRETDGQGDKYSTPYTRWRGEATSGTAVLATMFLNLMNGDWLRRPPWPLEALLVATIGAGLGWLVFRLRRVYALALAAGFALVIALLGVSLAYFTNYWFPWLVISAGQVPCAVACILFIPIRVSSLKKTGVDETIVLDLPDQTTPQIPDYQLFEKSFGEGGFGKVWLAQNAIGQWQAIKTVHRSNFKEDRAYEIEFDALRRYKPVSEQHSGLLRIEFVSQKKTEGFFYYVMELGDSETSGWENNPAAYRPRTLASVCAHAVGSRLPVPECLRIGTVLAEALDFLHSNNLTHRDIKPSNVIFVKGVPKLADVGLVTEARPPGQQATIIGTRGFMPPAPEPAGTKQADIYSLGVLLYVISTGQSADAFPDLATTLMERTAHAEFIKLNAIILKACQPDCRERYQTTKELLQALRKAQEVKT